MYGLYTLAKFFFPFVAKSLHRAVHDHETRELAWRAGDTPLTRIAVPFLPLRERRTRTGSGTHATASSTGNTSGQHTHRASRHDSAPHTDVVIHILHFMRKEIEA